MSVQINHPYFTASIVDGNISVEFDDPEEFARLVSTRKPDGERHMEVFTTWGEELYILTYDGDQLRCWERDDWQVYLEATTDTPPSMVSEISATSED